MSGTCIAHTLESQPSSVLLLKFYSFHSIDTNVFFPSYAVTTGLIEVLSRRCMKIRESIENYQSVVLSLLATLGLLTKFAELCPVGKWFYLLSYFPHTPLVTIRTVIMSESDFVICSVEIKLFP